MKPTKLISGKTLDLGPHAPPQTWEIQKGPVNWQFCKCIVFVDPNQKPRNLRKPLVITEQLQVFIPAKFKIFHNSIRMKIVSLSHNKTKYIMFNYIMWPSLMKEKLFETLSFQILLIMFPALPRKTWWFQTAIFELLLSSLDNIQFQHPSQALVITLNLLDL